MRAARSLVPLILALALLAAQSPPVTAAPVAHGAKTKKKTPKRGGCSTFCQQAGPVAGQGGKGCSPDPCVTQLTHKATLRSDGTVHLVLKCRRSVRCVGAIALWSNADLKPSGRRGGGDFSISAHRSATVIVPVLPVARSLLRAAGRIDLGTYIYVRGPRFVTGDLLTIAAQRP